MTHPQYPCPLGVCDKPCSLSDEAAVQIHEFMETMAANFLSCYGHQIQRHYGRKIKRTINAQQPWKDPPKPG